MPRCCRLHVQAHIGSALMAGMACLKAGQSCRSLPKRSRTVKLLPKPFTSHACCRKLKGRCAAVMSPSPATDQCRSVVELGKSGLKVPAVGIGAWAWGDQAGYWGYQVEYSREENWQAFQACLDTGLTFIDTAEVYGWGKSEELIGDFLRQAGPAAARVQVATKMAPLPWLNRYTPEDVVKALRASLHRLGRQKTDLYMIHWPGLLWNLHSNDAYIEGLACCKQEGLVDAVGVSNWNVPRLKSAVKQLATHGVALASNQVHYSLLYRAPETSGVMETCREHDITMVAYAPLNQGMLTGAFQPGGKKPFGPRALLFSDKRLREVQPLLALMDAIATERNISIPQVALNWCVCKGTIPIPGAVNAYQVHQAGEVLSFRLSEGEVMELDLTSSKIPQALGAPFENW